MVSKLVIGRKFVNTKTHLKTTVIETFDPLSEWNLNAYTAINYNFLNEPCSMSDVNKQGAEMFMNYSPWEENEYKKKLFGNARVC